MWFHQLGYSYFKTKSNDFIFYRYSADPTMPDNKLAQVRTISYSLEMFQFKTKMTTSISSNALGYNQYRQS